MGDMARLSRPESGARLDRENAVDSVDTDIMDIEIMDQLSSRTGDRTERSNKLVAERCLAHSALLPDIARGLASRDVAMVGDCAEVLTTVASSRPAFVAPFAKTLAPLLGHRNTRVRWETTHCIALVAALAPEVVADSLARLIEIIRDDSSIIVRDYAVAAVANYANSGATAAEAAFPVLKAALTLWNGRHAHHALAGLANVVRVTPEHASEIRAIARQTVDSDRAIVRKAAKALIRHSLPGEEIDT